MGTNLVLAKRDDLCGRVELVNRRLRLDAESEYRPGLDGTLVQEQIVAMEMDGHVEGALGRRYARHVIDVRVGQQNAADPQRVPLRVREQRLDFVARIDQHRLARLLAPGDEAVLEEWADGLRLDQHREPIIRA